MPDLPPIGSLWLHRESGERREVLNTGHFVCFRFSTSPHEPWCMYGRDFDSRRMWLSWAAHADRIDKEEA